MKIVLAAENLRLRDIAYPDISITEGAAAFLTGESGSGKSTLLRLFNGTLTPSSGRVLYNGRDIAGTDAVSLRREVLLAGQAVYLFDKTVRENFAEYYSYRDMAPPSDEKIREFLSLCLADFPLESLCASMSGGERQRVFTAICLSFMPKVLMLDEPTSALDTENAFRFMASLKAFCGKNGMTLVTVSHDKELVREFADEAFSLKRSGA